MDVPTVLMRGGTSKAVFFHEADLPAAAADREALILAALGSPDPHGRQIDGLGGGTTETSKVAIIGTGTEHGADVTFEFGQVLVDRPEISWEGTCGNISAAVGPFCLGEGLVPASDPVSTVRFFNTNTAKTVRSTFATSNGRFVPEGTCEIGGVPGTGSPVSLTFEDPGGASSGQLLPTGHVSDTVAVPGLGHIEVSVVDAANLFVFAPLEALRSRSVQPPSSGSVWDLSERIRTAASVQLGLVPDAAGLAANVPKIAFVSKPEPDDRRTQPTPDVATVIAEMASVGHMHPSYALTGAVATAAAARLPGTVVAEVLDGDSDNVEVRHPAGSMHMQVSLRPDSSGRPTIESVTGLRTARRLMSGVVHVPVR